MDQIPEPVLAPSLITADLRLRDLYPALAGLGSQRLDRLTDSLNLQIRLTRVHNRGRTSTCRTTHEQITIPTRLGSTPAFMVTRHSPFAFTPRDADATSAQRVLLVSKAPSGSTHCATPKI